MSEDNNKNNKHSGIAKVGKGFLTGFKNFISKGNILDLAVAVVVGAAFTAITNSLVNDLIMPIFGSFFNVSTIGDLILHIGEGEIKIGNFIMSIVNFFIIAFVLYVVVNVIIKNKQFRNSLKPKEEVKKEEVIDVLKDIRILLVSQDPTLKESILNKVTLLNQQVSNNTEEQEDEGSIETSKEVVEAEEKLEVLESEETKDNVEE
jgi:large conductance mechanosensitive channel